MVFYSKEILPRSYVHTQHAW